MAGLRDLGLGERQERGGVVGVGSGTGHINAFVKQRQLQKGRQARAGGSPADERSSPAAVGVDVSGGDLSFEDDFEDDRRDGNRDDGVGGGDQGADVGQVSLSVAPSTAPAAWQLRLHLQNTVLQLEKGLSSQVPFEVVEAEVQVRPCCSVLLFWKSVRIHHSTMFSLMLRSLPNCDGLSVGGWRLHYVQCVSRFTAWKPCGVQGPSDLMDNRACLWLNVPSYVSPGWLRLHHGFSSLGI